MKGIADYGGDASLGTGTALCCDDPDCPLCSNRDLVLTVYDLKTNPQFVIDQINEWLDGRSTGTFTVRQPATDEPIRARRSWLSTIFRKLKFL